MEVLFTILLGLAVTGDPGVTNAGFEQKEERTGTPSGWYYTSLPNNPDLVRYESKTVVSGNQSTNALAISVAANHPAESVAYNAHQELQGMSARKSYRVSAKIRTQGLSTMPMIAIQCLDATGMQHVGFSCSPVRKLSGDVEQWERIDTEVTIPDGTSTVRLRIGVMAEGNAGGTALIDDVEVVELPT